MCLSKNVKLRLGGVGSVIFEQLKFDSNKTPKNLYKGHWSLLDAIS